MNLIDQEIFVAQPPATCLYEGFLALPFYEKRNKTPVALISLACVIAHAMVYHH